PAVNTEVSYHFSSFWFLEPPSRCDGAVLVGRAQPTSGIPELLSAPGQPPTIIGKPVWKVTMVLMPHPPMNLSVSPFTFLPNVLPCPTGKSTMLPITSRCETSKPSRLRSPLRLWALASPQLGGAASSQLISLLVSSMSLAMV